MGALVTDHKRYEQVGMSFIVIATLEKQPCVTAEDLLNNEDDVPGGKRFIETVVESTVRKAVLVPGRCLFFSTSGLKAVGPAP